MVQHAEEPREPSPAIGNQARSRAQTREAGLGIPQPPPTLPSSLVREFTPFLVTCDASAYCCAFAGAHSICCWRLCGPGTLPGIDVEKLNVSNFSPSSAHFKGEINDVLPRKRHQQRHLEFCTVYLLSGRKINLSRCFGYAYEFWAILELLQSCSSVVCF